MLGYLVANKEIKPDPKCLQAVLDLPEPTCAKELKRVSGLLSYYAKWILSESCLSIVTLIKALRPCDSLSLDFSGPVRGVCLYLLVAVDKYLRFPFVFRCENMKLSTVTACLSSLFCVFGFPSCVHSDRGSPFVSQETRTYISARGISFSTATAYHPTGNSQCERFN